MSKIKLAILTGGDSSEREAALMGGEQVEKHINKEKYDYKVFDLPTDGTDRQWLIDLINWQPEVCFLALLGGHGENGSIPGLLETLHIPYCGSGVIASAIGMDKTVQRLVLNSVGIQTTEGMPVKTDEDAAAAVKKYGFPLVVKPNANGSSIGVTIVKNEEDYMPAIEKARSIDSEDYPVVEKFVAGPEVTCGVLEKDGEVLALRPIEIKVATEFYDYDAKYFDDRTSLELMPDSPLVDRIKSAAIAVYRALGCSGYGRVDSMVDENGEVFVMEINTLPGMTSHSLLPKAATEFWTYSELLDIIIGERLSHV